MDSCVGPRKEDLNINGRLNEETQDSQNSSFSSSSVMSASVSDLIAGEET